MVKILTVGTLAGMAGACCLAGCLSRAPELPRSAGERVDALPAAAWEASEWISVPGAKVAGEDEKKRQRAASGTSWFYAEVKNEKKVRRAVWMVTGLGIFEVFVNGKGVGSDALKPGFTHVRKTRRSFTYDVTGLMDLAAGAGNAFIAEVSAGWWRDKIVNYAGQKSAFRGVLEIEYADGEKKLYGTKAADWRAATGGPTVHAGIFDGEEYDARIPTPVSEPTQLTLAEKNAEFAGEILPSEGGEVCRRADRALVPVAAYTWKGVEGADPGKKIFGKVVKARTFEAGDELFVRPGETLVVDFGQNCAGVPLFKMRSAPDAVLTCLPGEMLNDANGERSRGNDGPGGSLYRENLRMPADGMRLVYTFTGDENGEKYMPRFTFFGYRYLSITATEPVLITSLFSVPVSSIAADMELGRIETGNADVNKLISNVYWGQLSNYLSVPTDCPQRNERLGWTADTQVFAEAGTFNADTRRFFRKWMRDMVDSRDADGGFPSVAPFAQYGNETFNLGWADAGVIVPWTVWKQFGDTRIVEENWEAMAKFVRKLDETKYKYDDKHYTYADWLSYETFETCGNKFGNWGKWKNDPDAKNYREFLAACYWLYDSRLMVQMAEATGKAADAGAFRACARRALAYIRKTYVEPDGLLLKPMRGLQTACVFALKFGIVEGRAAEETKGILLKSIKDHGDCLQTGFLGTGFLMDVLTQIGASDVAYTLLLQHRNPSWLYSVDQGATTIWERWNSYVKDTGFGPVGMNSFNHYAYGSVLAWMYKNMAGIAADPSAPGFKRIVMAPQPDPRIGSVSAEYKTPQGVVKSAWRYTGDKWTWTFTVPDGCKAQVTVPGDAESRLYGPGTYEIAR
ncbi:MAG: family 78 glycoside hydrolase catalytic domain [Kiritimatiellia bacterium]